MDQTNAKPGHVLVGTRMGSHVNTQCVKPPFSHEYWVTDANEVIVTEATEADIARHAPQEKTHA